MRLIPLILFLSVAASTGFSSRIVCYYTNWSRYGSPVFKIEDIEPSLCTHAVYSFFGVDEHGVVASIDPWNDVGDEWTEGGIQRFVRLRNKNPSLKLLLGVGGYTQGPLNFQKIVQSPEKRKTFLETSLNLLRQYNFNGLEIDWVWHSGGATPEDKKNFSQLLKEMKAKFKAAGFLLTVATSANPEIFDGAYDIQTIAENVDYINVMSYDLHGSWDGKTGHVAPLHGMKNEPPKEQWMNVEAVINRYIQKGAAPEKLNVGLVSYGRTFTLRDPTVNGINAPAKAPGKVEPLPYRTFCLQDMNKIWKKFRNEEQAIPYAVNGDQWVGYEDVQSLREKVKFSKTKKLGGVTFWSLDFDDFKGECKSGTFPLLKAINAELNGKKLLSV